EVATPAYAGSDGEQISEMYAKEWQARSKINSFAGVTADCVASMNHEWQAKSDRPGISETGRNDRRQTCCGHECPQVTLAGDDRQSHRRSRTRARTPKDTDGSGG